MPAARAGVHVIHTQTSNNAVAAPPSLLRQAVTTSRSNRAHLRVKPLVCAGAMRGADKTVMAAAVLSREQSSADPRVTSAAVLHRNTSMTEAI